MATLHNQFVPGDDWSIAANLLLKAFCLLSAFLCMNGMQGYHQGVVKTLRRLRINAPLRQLRAEVRYYSILMNSRRITSADLVGVTGFSRHRLRSFLKDIPEYADRQGTARVAREYSRQDLAVITICCVMEERYGIRREVIAQLVPEVRRVLGVPRVLATNAFLIVIPCPPSARYMDGISDVEEGTVIPLSDILNRVDIYLLGDQVAEPDGQRNLDLRPISIARAGVPKLLKPAKQRKIGSQNAIG